MEKLANNISDRIAEKLGYDGEKRSVIAYGLIAIFQMLSIFAITSVIGIVGKFWLESMVIFLAVGILRKSTGGAHSNTFQSCIILSIFSISFLGFLANHIFLFNFRRMAYYAVSFSLLFLVCFWLVYRLAPVASPKKPIVKPEKIRRLRIGSIVTLAVYYAVTLCLVFLSARFENPKLINIATSLMFAALWQVFTLTKTGHKVISQIDGKLSAD